MLTVLPTGPAIIIVIRGCVHGEPIAWRVKTKRCKLCRIAPKTPMATRKTGVGC